LTPRYLRVKIKEISIGLFLHCPFPASEIFKLIPYRKSLLISLLNCDCLGFHSFEYARNFFTTCKRVLGVNFEYQKTGQLGIDYHGRNVSLVISHVGVSYESIYKQMKAPKMKRLLKTSSQSKRKIFASVDTLSHIAGLKEKFLSYQQFLRADPSHAKTCKLIQYLDPVSIGKMPHIKEYKEIIFTIKDEIVKEFGPQVISVKIEPLTESKRLMLWSRTHVLLNTTLRGGLRLPSLEYIAVRCILGLEGKSLIILSEFAGGIRALDGVLKCNPYSIKNTSTALERGYNISSKEKTRRMRNMLKYVIRHSTESWANQFLRDIKIAHNQMESSLFLGIVSDYVKHRLIHQSTIKELDKNVLLNAYSETSNRLIIIDTKGINNPKDDGDFLGYSTTTYELADSMINLLDALSRNEDNKLWLFSPEKKQQISSKLRTIEK
jgi:trehalose 6-phosphate synthase/phosphatase